MRRMAAQEVAEAVGCPFLAGERYPDTYAAPSHFLYRLCLASLDTFFLAPVDSQVNFPPLEVH